jgi:hypothetical protein
MCFPEAKSLGDRVIKDMIAANALVREEGCVKFGPGTISGVLFQLTGTGCYSSKVHIYGNKGQCYTHYCMRALKILDLDSSPETKFEDWATFYHLKKEDIGIRDKKEISRQHLLHEVVTSEDLYIDQLDVLRALYRERLTAINPPFISDLFSSVDKVRKVNQDYLLRRLRHRQTEQGPWIVGFSDIFREWIYKARTVYFEYATNLPLAEYTIRREMERNTSFEQFLEQVRLDKRSKRLSWDFHLKAPINRLARYSLLLVCGQKNIPTESEARNNLLAQDEIRAAISECSSKYTEMTKKMELSEMEMKLRFQSSLESELKLSVDHRKIVFRGDLKLAEGDQQVGIYAILFDHYLVLAKPLVQYHERRSRKDQHYDVSKAPIPMDLLVLESSVDAAGSKLSVKGSDGTTLYPFRVRHLVTTETHTLYSFSAQIRQDWCEAISLAKTNYVEATFYPKRAL